MVERTSVRRKHRRIALGAAAIAVIVAFTGIVASDTGARSGTAAGSTLGSTSATDGAATTPSGTATSGPPTGISLSTSEPVSRPPASGIGTVLPAGFSLKAGDAAAAAPVNTPVLAGETLPRDAVARLLLRLPAWTKTSAPTTDFRWPAQSSKRPAAGQTITQPFPAAPDSQQPSSPPAAPPSGPLTVLRMQPQGAVAVAPFVSITFSQPMVPVGTVGQLAAGKVPASVSPAIAGLWDWLGTSTIRFTADSTAVDRLPMATRFTVTVPAGTRSAGGGTLAAPATATFSTPPPSVKTFSPDRSEPVPLRPVLVAVFDQRVDPATVLPSVTVTAADRPWPVRIATTAEIDADPRAAALWSSAPAGRAVAVIPVRDFPAATAIGVRVKAGTRSAEGPLTSTRNADFGFSTFAPMRLTQSSCADLACQPGSPIRLEFANPIDADSFDPTSVTVSPTVPGGITVSAADNLIFVSGATQPATTYRVTVPPGLTDTFGQRMASKALGTATITHASTRIYPFATTVSTLDPLSPGRTLTITTVNQKRLRERVFAVSTTDWASYQSWYLQLLQNGNQPAGSRVRAPSWPVLTDRTVTIPAGSDRLVSTQLDLAGQLSGARTQAVVLIEPIDALSTDDRWQNQPTTTWVQATNLGVDASVDQTSLHTWVTDLRTGSPVPGVTVTLVDSRGRPLPTTLTTDVRGQGSVALPAGGAGTLIARQGDQIALLPGDLWGGDWRPAPRADRLLFYVTDDRGTYRPGETVSVKGWVRRQADTPTLALTIPASGRVRWSAVDGEGISIGKGTAPVDRAGGFQLTLAIPAGAHLGHAGLHLDLGSASPTGNDFTDHFFDIADFRTPAFQVDTHAGGTDPAIRGTGLAVQTDATYYAGGPVGAAPVDWQVRTAPAEYAPPGWGEFTFGVWTPWWYGSQGYDGQGYRSSPPGPAPGGGSPDSTVQTFHNRTDGAGSNVLDVTVGKLGKDTDGLPVSVLAQATVTDVNRQQIAGTADVVVHPARYYVGLASDSTYVTQGDKLTMRAVATGIDGAAAPGRPLTVTAARVTGGWSYQPGGQSTDTVTDPHTCTVTSAATPVSCTFTPTLGGEYRITATVSDEQGRTSRTQLTRWVAGPDGLTATTVAEQSLTLIPDRQEYQPGQSAQLLVASPFPTGTGLLTLSHHGIVSSHTFQVSGSSAVVPIPITPASVPGLTATVEVVGTAPRAGDPAGGGGTRPAYATGSIDLNVSTLSRGLTVTSKPRESTVKPGGRTTIDVTVSDRAGKPVAGSQFELIVVDEAVLALGGYQLSDPLEAFYPRDEQDRVQTSYGRATVVLGTPPVGNDGISGASSSSAMSSDAMSGSAAAAASGSPASASSGTDRAVAAPPGAGRTTAGAKRAPGALIPTRTTFTPLALFRPTVTTGADGTAAIPITLPDNLTRYRVMAVAVAGSDRFGTGESTITGALPLTVRPSPPRFLNFGDRAELPVVVQNLTGAPRSTDVVLQASALGVPGAVVTDPAPAVGKRVTVPANGRVEVRFAVAAEQVGTARFRVAAVSGDDADAAQQEFPVYTPATSETFATYGSLDPAKSGSKVIEQQVSKPAGVLPGFGGLDISTSSTALAQLTDAVAFVAADDYASSDGLAAQVLAISAVGDVLQAFSAPGLASPAQLHALVAADLSKLLALQNSDGGFPYWTHDDRSDPFNSVQVVQALLLADKRGYTGTAHTAVAAAVHKAGPYLREVDQKLPAGTSQQTRDTLNAYALAVRAAAGDTTAAAAAGQLVTTRGAALPMAAVAQLLPLVAQTQREVLLTRVRNAAVDDAGSVTFTESVTDDAWTVLHSDTRTDALILDALLTVDPKSDLIGKAVRGLLGRQQGGQWNNLQDNTFALVAMRHYYDTQEAATPNFVASVWLGDRLAGQHRYSGRTTEQTKAVIPTSAVLDQGNTSLTLADNGSGRMYYRIGLTTAPAGLAVPALDRGFSVIRSYAGADNAADVTRGAAGVWQIKAGARVRVTLTMVSRSAQTHVALADPLPAGLEALNPALATTSRDLAGKNAAGADPDPFTWNPTWYDHQDLRDDRAEAFAGYLPGGVYTYSYLAAATTPGSFVVPPTTAKQVYAPETFGRTGTDRVVVG